MAEGDITRRALRDLLDRKRRNKTRNRLERQQRAREEANRPAEEPPSRPAEISKEQSLTTAGEEEHCSRCNGSGTVFSRQNQKLKNQRAPCPVCDGKGKTRR